MIPLLYEKDGINKIGELSNCIECLVEEERNGLFELTIIYPTTDSIFNSLEEENIIICNANDTLKNQKFRIYMTKKLMSNRIEVYARHISFDLAYDTVDNIDITNQSCEYALNSIFRQSQFSTNYRGHSDIINAQNYKMSNTNCISAIAGERGSIIDTYGTGAEILRDNTDIHVLNRRGNDNEVTIEYAKNLTGFELEEDFSELVTRINAIAKYTDNETNEEFTVEAKGIDSPLISNYSHPYIAYIDYSDKFQEEKPTEDKLIKLAKKEYSVNKKDKPKQNFKIEFIPLSKCVGYEDLEDKISLCDTVTIIDTRYGVDTKAKVIRVVFNVLKDRYESMELGEPRTTLGDIIGNGGNTEEGKPGPPGPPGPPGADGNIGDFPNSLPSVPVLSAKVYGFATIELSWTFENKVYYQYELYASKTKDFTPNTFDLIHQGQTSTFLFQAEPNETWYFRVCAINSHGNRTDFSTQVTVTTTKIEDLSNYVENASIGEALIGELNLGRGWFGQLRGNYIDAKQLSVTDGNGKRTLDIDSFGNVNLDVTSLKIVNKSVATEEFTQSKIESLSDSINIRVESVENKQSSTDGKVSALETWKKSAEQKITDEAIISTVSSSFYKKDQSDRLYASQSEINQLANQISSKVDENGVSSIIKQNSDAIRIGFNGIDNRTQIDTNGLSMYNPQGVKTTMLKLGNIYQYNGSTGTFLGGYLSSRTSSANNLSVVGSYNTKQWIVSRSSGWQNDDDNAPSSVTDYFFVNFVDIGSNKTGIHLATKTYSHSTLYMQSNNIENANNISCSDINVGNNIRCYKVLASQGMQTNIWYNSGGSQLIRYDGSKMNLGASINTNGFSVSNSSDVRLKKDIQYVDEVPYTNNESNLKATLYNEFKDKFKFATFRYKKEELANKEHFGFMAQDLLGTVFEKYILDNPNSECVEGDYLTYDLTEFTTMIAGVLQEEINVRDKQIESLEARLNKLEKLLEV